MMSTAIISTAKTITLTPNSNIDNILLNYPSGRIFKFPPGNYYLTKTFVINKSNIKFTGTTVKENDTHIFQTNTSADGISIVSCNKIVIENLSLHVEHVNCVALVGASINNCIIQNCYFYGNSNTFTIYLAGPTHLLAGTNTLNAYNTNVIDNGNIFRKNVVYSNWSGDCLSFSLQNNGILTGNVVRGGKIAVYMCKNCAITANNIYDSSDIGIFVSLPSHNLTIRGNVIYECNVTGIKVADQIEHGSFTTTPYNMLISENKIVDPTSSDIEINNGMNIIIENNSLISASVYGIYALNSSNLTIRNNKIAYFNVSVWFETVINSLITGNLIMSVFPNEGNNAIKFSKDSTGNTIQNNTTKGKLKYDIYAIPNEAGATMIGNVYNMYYEKEEELAIIKFK